MKDRNWPALDYCMILFTDLHLQETDPEEEATKGLAVGVLFAAAVTSTSVQSISVILEEAVVLEDIQVLPTASAYLFGLLCAVNISYPKTLKKTFDAPQKHVYGNRL